MRKPVGEDEADLAEVLLAKHVFVPDDELDRTQLVDDRAVDGEVERRVFGRVLRVEGLLGHRCLVLCREHSDRHESAGAMSLHSCEGAKTQKKGTNGAGNAD
jgi:hypothetical protein